VRVERFREALHRFVVREDVAAHATDTHEPRALSQDLREHGSEPDSAPTVSDYQSELGGFRIVVTNEACFRNERCGSIRGEIVIFGDERNMSTIIDRCERAQELLREFVDRTVKSKSHGRPR
jgi:hypothetical protein